MHTNGCDKRGVIVLAGGASRRMGQDKWTLDAAGLTVMERIIAVLYPLASELWIIAAGVDQLKDSRKFPDLNDSYPLVQMAYDTVTEAGPLAGMAAGMGQCSSDYVLVTASDMPFPSKVLAEKLFERCINDGFEAAVPQWGGKLHPLFAVYRKGLLAGLNLYIASGERKVMGWLEGLNYGILAEKEIKQLDPQGTALFNMNNREDYHWALTHLKDQEHLLE